MKKLLIFILLCGFCAPTFASVSRKEKVVEASSNRKPDWIGRSNSSALAVTEVGETLSDASERCLATIRQQIINAVAVNISSTETMITHQVTRDDLVSLMNDYSSQVTTHAAQLPYIHDITLSNAEDIYWERIYNKQEQRYRYEYSVRYPFTEQMRQDLIDAFLAIDNDRMADLKRLRLGLEKIDNIDRIREALTELDGLSDYFFDAVRKRETETVRRNYLDLYRQISIVVDSESLGSCLYSLQLKGRRLTTSVTPRLNSESALAMQVKAVGDGYYRLTYDAEYASPSEINEIEILYLFGGSRVSKRILFDPAENKASLRPVGTVHVEQSDSLLQGTLLLRIAGNDVQVTHLSIQNPADNTLIVAQITDAPRLVQGERNLGFTAVGTLGHAASGMDIIRGTLVYTNLADGSSTEIKFILPFKLTVK